ncbi:MAG TPA: rhomboid family intramembrane serine protease [Nocardioidaceae bacterium]|jgi:membrane associated rhomboid family serine protease|nr:rhomboid family intramembrane serine protease [Nocardioidaceae bacterium]
MSTTTRRQGRSRPLVAAQVIVGFVALLYLVELVDTLDRNRLDGYGIRPREVDGLDGIVFAPLLHHGWAHLAANTVPLLVFGFLILLAGVARWVAVTAVVWVVGGVGTWVTGQPHSLHLGASVLAFGWLVYLLLRGIFARDAAQVALGAILLFLYGGILYGVLPGQPGISWQGHLFGALGGALAAYRFGATDRLSRRRQPQ